MSISKRLLEVAQLIDKCNCTIDIGTDHGYIPIYLIKNNICSKVIASDINKGPLNKAISNGSFYGLNKSIDFRLGPGLSVTSEGECNFAVIAGMGGYLIKDIIKDNINIFKSLDGAVLQPMKNVDILRKFIMNENLYIEDEKLVFDEGLFYQIIKVNCKKKCIYEISDEMDYEIPKMLFYNKDPLLKEYLNYEINEAEKILKIIKDDTENAITRKKQLEARIKALKKRQELIC